MIRTYSLMNLWLFAILLMERYLKRLQEIEDTLLISTFFRTHEVIGSSLLFIHDTNGKCGIWLIDFGKTTPLTNGHTINHKSPWVLGNHEDGYLIGLSNIISIWKNLFNQNSNSKNET